MPELPLLMDCFADFDGETGDKFWNGLSKTGVVK